MFDQTGLFSMFVFSSCFFLVGIQFHSHNILMFLGRLSRSLSLYMYVK